MRHVSLCGFLRVSVVGLFLAPSCCLADEPAPPASAVASSSMDLYRRENLVAWCIVPFDAKQRGPVDRVAMLSRLGFKKYAYDWRAEHLPTFDAELMELKKHGIELTAVWFPTALNKDAQFLLDRLQAHGVRTQLWVTGGGEATGNAQEQQARVEAEANRIRPIAEAAAKIGCTVALYNHGGWFGEPENQLAVIAKLQLPNVGLVYNLHHGHDHLDRFPKLLAAMKPHLWVVNLNGTTRGGDRNGKKILPLATGELDLTLLRQIRDSGWRGPIGILNHTGHDAEARLLDNLDGLAWLVPQLEGKPPGPQPKLRTPDAPAAKAQGGAKPPCDDLKQVDDLLPLTSCQSPLESAAWPPARSPRRRCTSDEIV